MVPPLPPVLQVRPARCAFPLLIESKGPSAEGVVRGGPGQSELGPPDTALVPIRNAKLRRAFEERDPNFGARHLRLRAVSTAGENR
jgi:hypothetical protein